MCTVTIIPNGTRDFVLTSNRDEAPNRNTLEPDFYLLKGVNTLFPKDELAGGTWIGVSDKNRVICVLNGGFILHKRKLNYRLSRGVVAKDFMTSDDIETTLEAYNFENIEPFTMVIVDWNATLKFFELVWDGENKHVSLLPNEPKIWSSSTLYTAAMKKERLQWFEDFKAENELNSSSVLKFHKTAGKNNEDYGVVMNRGFVKTTSVTQITKQSEAVEMRYENLQNTTVSTKIFNLSQVVNG